MPKNMISEKRKLAKIDAFISRALGRELNELSSLRQNYQKFWRILKNFFFSFLGDISFGRFEVIL